MLNSIAVLIDADNASAKTIGTVLQKIQTLGNITTKKIYGDWSQSNLNGWQEAILRHAIEPMQQFAYVKGKNATDIALVIEAMDLLHSGDYDGFCLVSSDSDFASLAVRIRKNAIPVYGFGKQNAVVSFRQACDEFFEVETLLDTHQKALKLQNPTTRKELRGDTKLVNALRDMIASHANPQDDHWADYRKVLNDFNKKYPALSHENYGYSKLIHLIKAIDLFEIKNGENESQLFVRSPQEKPVAQTTQSKAPQKKTTTQLQADKALIQAISDIITSDPKKENGWTNLSYVASQLKQQHGKTGEMYGYKKFSDLITAIRLFDIKKDPSGTYVKLKQPKTAKSDPQNPPPPKKEQTAPQTQTTPDPNQPLLLNGKIDFYVYANKPLDSVLWRLTGNKRVRNDSDIIFYGQTHSADGTLSLDINDVYSGFSCQLDHQAPDVARIIITASHESDTIAHTPIKFNIEQAGKVLFTGNCATDNTHARTILLGDLAKTLAGWQFNPKNQATTANLYQLCQHFGVEVDQD